MYGINEILLQQERGDYSEHLIDGEYVLDCSMGSNPYGSPEFTIPADVMAELAHYPHSDAELTEMIRMRFADTLDIADDMVAFSCGSVGTCLALNRMVCRPGKTVICMAPTFTAATDDMVTYGVEFVRVYLRPERNYAFDADEVIAAIEAHPQAYVYIDNPNNPTGQVFPLSDVRRIVAAAQAADSFIVMDEAYGDYMEDEESALALVPEFDNLAVVRTFSKGYGEAGVRLGYCIAQPSVIAAFQKVNVPFSKNSIADAFAIQTMQADWGRKTLVHVKRDKPNLIEAVRGCDNLKIAETSTGVSISMLYVEDKDVNLEKTLLHAGVRVVTCNGYDGLGQNAVRVNLHEDIDTLVELVRKADTLV